MQSAGLLAERSRLIGLLRAESAPQRPTATATPALPVGPPVLPVVPVAPRPPAPEWTRKKVQNLLLSLGAGLLAVLALPPALFTVALAGSAPGAAAVTFAAAVLTLAAAAVIAPAHGAPSEEMG